MRGNMLRSCDQWFVGKTGAIGYLEPDWRGLLLGDPHETLHAVTADRACNSDVVRMPRNREKSDGNDSAAGIKRGSNVLCVRRHQRARHEGSDAPTSPTPAGQLEKG